MSGWRVNIGCGATPTPGWLNFDSSWSVRVARVPLAPRALAAVGLLPPSSAAFIAKVRRASIRWADAARHVPLPDASAAAVYSSHMFEHLDRVEAPRFLAETRRLLASGGVLRLAVPDLALLAARYASDRDADRFVHTTMMSSLKPRTLKERFVSVVVGPRHHHWMYDGASLEKILAASGFAGAAVIPAGSTTMADPGALDLYERADETVYVEARKP